MTVFPAFIPTGRRSQITVGIEPADRDPPLMARGRRPQARGSPSNPDSGVAILQSMNQAARATAVDVASMPWVFTQRHPLDTSSFIDEAKKRGIELDLSTLRELYRYGLLAPFVELTYRPVRAPFKPDEPEPMAGSSRLMQIREARDTGCLRDLSAEPFKPHLPFERGRQKSRFWWNGLIYSQYQLLALPMLADLLDRRTHQKRGQHRVARIPTPHPSCCSRRCTSAWIAWRR